VESLSTCLICGADRLDPLVAIDRWTVVECRDCGLGILSPRPDPSELSTLYEEPYFVAQEMRHRSAAEADRGLRAQRKRVALVRSFVRGGRLLDVGCAVGDFLVAAKRRGFEVEGVEYSAWAADEAIRRLGGPVHIGDIHRLAGSDRRFDAVTMWHVLEHTRDPIADLTAARGVLSDGGWLFIELPNYQSIDAKRSGPDWQGWQLPYHFWHFTPGSLSRLLVKCGFEVIALKRHPSSYVRNALKPIPLVGLFRNLVCLFYPGRDFTLVARKAT
jgi:ubiquinone/menaquinone biosynthesis C-methylase UbiE